MTIVIRTTSITFFSKLLTTIILDKQVPIQRKKRSSHEISIIEILLSKKCVVSKIRKQITGSIDEYFPLPSPNSKIQSTNIRRTQFLTLIHLPSATFTFLAYTTLEQRYSRRNNRLKLTNGWFRIHGKHHEYSLEVDAGCGGLRIACSRHNVWESRRPRRANEKGPPIERGRYISPVIASILDCLANTRLLYFNVTVTAVSDNPENRFSYPWTLTSG